MQDIIYRRSAIDAIDKYNAWGYVDESFEKLEKALLELPSAQQWVPCSERLPKEKSDWKTVTVLDESGDTPFTYTSVGYYLSDGWWIVDNEPMEEGNLIRVIAWMPLPEPYVCFNRLGFKG